MSQKFECPICGKKLKYVSEHLINTHKLSRYNDKVREYWKKEYERDKNEEKAKEEKIEEKEIQSPKKDLSNPPHWYFPISYKEMRRRKLENTKKALKDMGLTFSDLKRMKIKKKK